MVDHEGVIHFEELTYRDFKNAIDLEEDQENLVKVLKISEF